MGSLIQEGSPKAVQTCLWGQGLSSLRGSEIFTLTHVTNALPNQSAKFSLNDGMLHILHVITTQLTNLPLRVE